MGRKPKNDTEDSRTSPIHPHGHTMSKAEEKESLIRLDVGSDNQTLLSAVRSSSAAPEPSMPSDPDLERMISARDNLYPGSFIGGWSIAVVITLVLLLVAGPLIAGLSVQPSPPLFSDTPISSPFIHHIFSNLFIDSGVSPTEARVAGTLSFLFLPPAIAVILLLFFRHRTRADYQGISKFMCCGMLGAIPISLVELLLLALLALGLSAFSPIEVWWQRMQSLTSGQPLGLQGASEYAILAFAIIFMSFVMAAFTEGAVPPFLSWSHGPSETFKFLVALLVKSYRPIARHPYTVVLYVTMGALGFATLENFFYVAQSAASGSVANVAVNAVERAFLSVPVHTVTGLLIGARMARLPQVPHQQPSFRDYLGLIWLPILIHGTFDLVAFSAPILGGWYQLLYLILPALLGLGGWKAYREVTPLLVLPDYDVVILPASTVVGNV